MPPSRTVAPSSVPGCGLDALAAAARHDFARMRYPAANWVPPAQGPDGKPALDVLIIGGGMCGQTAALALKRDGVRNLRIIDRAPHGHEGPWGTYARMDILRSPKHLTGPDLGFPALTFRAWYEAQHGAQGWERLYKIATRDWLDYLLWVREVAGIGVENGIEAIEIEPGRPFVRAVLRGAGGADTVWARKVVMAGGRDGSGAPYVPTFPSLRSGQLGAAYGRVFHSSDAIDFARFRGGRVGVLGASASAFDNAAVALETGAREVRLFCRRPHLPQINKSKGMVFAGFFEGYRQLDDRRRWEIYTYILSEATPPPHESVLRCDAHAGFAIQFAEPWLDVIPAESGVTIVTPRGRQAFDAAILATGFSVDLSLRPELACVHDKIALWADRIGPEAVAEHPEYARFPYLGPGFELVERTPGALPGLDNVHCFNAGATISQAALAGDIPGLAYGANCLARAIASALFVAEVDKITPALEGFDDRELEPTRYFLPR
jgi:cation diffusion facilitator CzcD-associated flavoprotein CzcO